MRFNFRPPGLLLMFLLFCFCATKAGAQVVADNTVIPPVTVFAPTDRPSSPYSGILDLEGVSFGERFSGQTVNAVSPETVSGSPSGPLVLLAGADETNLQVGDNGAGVGQIAGCGPSVCNWFDGALSLLLDEDAAELSIEYVIGGNFPGTATIRLFARDGTLLREGFSNISQTAGFRVESGPLIAGATITVAERQGNQTFFLLRAVKIPESAAAVPLSPLLPVFLFGSLVLCGIKHLGANAE